MSTGTNPTRALSAAPCRARIAAFLAAALLIGPPRGSIAAASAPRTFSSATEASDALFQAVRSGDRHAIEAILGASHDLASCGDEARDGRERARFVEKYQQMHRLVREPDGSTVLYVGAENWPFPVPLVASARRWYFDAKAGQREVVFRRIGANEATAIEVSRRAVQAATRNETRPSDGDPLVDYAERLAAAARANDDAAGDATPDEKPFHGYHFVVLKQGAITLIAYPAEYRSSGVMTFVVGHDGVVRERDLGPDTASKARKLKTVPASGWRTVG